MSDLLQFPFDRNQYPAIDNPIYVSDIVAANQSLLSALTAIAGLGAGDFAIFGGLQYVEVLSGTNYYTPGFFYLKGVWYYQPVTVNEGQYLIPNVTGELPYTFTDAVTRPLYNVNLGQTSNISTPSSTPQFSGNMNVYRLDLKSLVNSISNLAYMVSVEQVYPGDFGGTQTLMFTHDQSIFYVGNSSSVVITFDMTGAIPGTVITLFFAMGPNILAVNPPSGVVAYIESGNLSSAGGNTNTMYFLYAGVDGSANKQIRYNISQV